MGRTAAVQEEKDSELDRYELTQLLQQLPDFQNFPIDPLTVQRVINSVDENNSGTLDCEEFLSLMSRIRKHATRKRMGRAAFLELAGQPAAADVSRVTLDADTLVRVAKKLSHTLEHELARDMVTEASSGDDKVTAEQFLDAVCSPAVIPQSALERMQNPETKKSKSNAVSTA